MPFYKIVPYIEALFYKKKVLITQIFFYKTRAKLILQRLSNIIVILIYLRVIINILEYEIVRLKIDTKVL